MQQIIEKTIKHGCLVGIGSGKTMAKLISFLPKTNTYVSASFATLELLHKHNLPVQHLKLTSTLDLYYDSADFVDKKKNLLKGGGGCIVKEKFMMSIAKECVIIVQNEKKMLNFVNKTVMIEIAPYTYMYIIDYLTKNNIKFCLRECRCKNGPIVTENGNYIFDCEFSEKLMLIIKNNKIIIQNGYVDSDEYKYSVHYIQD